ncbi:MAG: TonB-dependent receptor, partial [Acidobacteriota bacterium]|nr:TonB-dependent receptor [Acidobacteriota bacterium]
MNGPARFLFILFVLLNLSIIAAAQATTGTVVVTVTDQTGTPIPGATIKILPEELATGGSLTGSTNDEGIAEFTNIPPGKYRVTAGFSNFKESDNYFLAVSDSTKFLHFALEDRVTQLMHGPDFDPNPDKYSKDSGVIRTEIDETLPSSPNHRSLLDIAPFVRDERLTGGISVDGATEPDNTYFIDGQEVTNPTSGVLNRNHNLPFTLIQEVSVNSGAQKAEFNGSIGGVVNIVTQGGNDRWRGDVGFSFTPSGLNGDARPVLNRYGAGSGEFEFFTPNKDGSDAYFPHGSIGGPVFKEKLWFFGSYSPQLFRNRRTIDYYNTGAPNRTVTQTIEYGENLRQEFAYLRLDTQPAKTLKGTISFLYNPTIQEGRLPSVDEGLFGVPQFANGLSGAGLLATQGGRNNSNIVNGNLNWTPISKLFLNFRAGRVFLNEKLDSYGAIDQTRYLCSSVGTPQNVPGSNCSPGFNTSSNFVNRHDANTRTSASIDGGLVGINALGRHQIRIGYQYDRVDREVNQGYVDTGYIVLYYGLSIANLIGLTPTGSQCNYTMNPNPTNCWVGAGLMQRFGEQADTKGSSHAVYGQDTWQITDRVTINAGVRFESEIVPEYGEIESIRFGWREKVSPRFGAAFDVFGNGKSRVFGSYFWNYDRLKNNVIESNGGGVFVRDYFEILPERGVSYTNYTFNNILGGQTDPFDFQCPISNGPGYSV